MAVPVQNVFMPVVPVAATPLLSVPDILLQLVPEVSNVALGIVLLPGCAKTRVFIKSVNTPKLTIGIRSFR